MCLRICVFVLSHDEHTTAEFVYNLLWSERNFGSLLCCTICLCVRISMPFAVGFDKTTFTHTVKYVCAVL